VAERLNAVDSKSTLGVTLTWVQIPPSPYIQASSGKRAPYQRRVRAPYHIINFPIKNQLGLAEKAYRLNKLAPHSLKNIKFVAYFSNLPSNFPRKCKSFEPRLCYKFHFLGQKKIKTLIWLAFCFY
jgi:hypothetical protein